MGENRKRKLVLASASIACKRFMESVCNIMDTDSSDSSDGEDENFIIMNNENFSVVMCSLLKSLSANRNFNVPRVENYFEVVIPSYDDKAFQSHFRLSRQSYESLYLLVEPILRTKYEYARPREQIRKKILAVLWLLATPGSYRSVGDRFNFGEASLSDWVFMVIRAVYELAPMLIKWPSAGDQKTVIREKFKRFANIKHAIGAVDGTFIPIKKPEKHAETYLTRKCKYTFTLQGISEPSLKFTNTFIGYPGSVSDYRIFTNSLIYRRIVENPGNYFSDEEYILGDKAYPLTNWCLTPYIARANLTSSQTYFNESHAKTRQVIERTFCLFFGRFRRFKYLDMSCTELIPKVVVAVCVLHNLCINNDNELEAYIEEGQQIVQEIHGIEENVAILQSNPIRENNIGQMRRDNISLQLFLNRRR